MYNPIEHDTNTIARYLFAIKNDEKYFTPCATRETFRISRLLQKTDARGHRLKRSVTSIHKLATGTLSFPLHLPSHPYQFHNTIRSRHSSSKLSFLLLESSLLAAIRLIDNVVGDTVISSPSPLFFFFFISFCNAISTRKEADVVHTVFRMPKQRISGIGVPGFCLETRDTGNPFCNFPGSNGTPFETFRISSWRFATKLAQRARKMEEFIAEKGNVFFYNDD